MPGAEWTTIRTNSPAVCGSAQIAMAMAMNPALLIADEPTTALDVTVQAQVLRVMGDLQREFGTALIMITHDLGVIADIADDVVVMYAGAVMERADRRSMFYRFHHPYTEGLLLSLPVPGDRRRLTPIPGQPPSLITLPSGCPFHPRCRYAFDQCREQTPPLRDVPDKAAHVSACWLPTRSEERDGVRQMVRAGADAAAAGSSDYDRRPAIRAGAAGGEERRQGVPDPGASREQRVQAVTDVSFEIRRGDRWAGRRDRLWKVHSGPLRDPAA
jgi:oligopeptide/dipeptide ABC transporter ATP-binding protein